MSSAALAELATRWGVQTGYWDVSGTWHDASPESLLVVLRELGAPISSEADCPGALGEHERSLAELAVAPVVVAPAGTSMALDLRLPSGFDGRIEIALQTEAGEVLEARIPAGELPRRGSGEADGRSWFEVRVETGWVMPPGYHSATISFDRRSSVVQVLAPPTALPQPSSPLWGVFAPTYAFPPEGAPGREHLGVGNVGDLDRLAEGIAALGGRVVSTLPLLATFLDDHFEPSPYSPVSRRWWGELHLDPSRLPGLAESPTAAALLSSNRVQEAAAALASARLVEHREAARLVREVLEAVSGDLRASRGPTAQALEAFARERPELESYALFRALAEQGDVPPAGTSLGRRAPDPASIGRHRYAQLAAERQIAELAARHRERGQLLALDLPLGSNPAGFDVWASPEEFASAVATGAPPDDFFRSGQNWGFPPPHPLRSRERAHRELTQALRHHLRHSDLLRIDHLMSLERLWWIPDGRSPAEGVYVRYPTEELMAVVAIEAGRAGAVVVGENLGTVSDEINQTMKSWGMLGMYELQFETWRAREQGELRQPSPDTVAGLNTHDMATFAGWWAGRDLIEAVELGLMDEASGEQAMLRRAAEREATAEVLGRDLGAVVRAECGAVLRGALEWLGRSPAAVVLATFEDLWLEEEPQNVPGTHLERPNWRRRYSQRLSSALASTEVLDALSALDAARRSSTTGEDAP